MLGNKKITSGCSSDLSRATQTAYGYVMKYGFDDEKANLVVHGQILSDEDLDPRGKRVPNLSEQAHFELDKRANALIIERCWFGAG